MANKIIVIICFLWLTSCCDIHMTSMHGLRSKRLYKRYLNDRVNPIDLKIETDKVYKMINQQYVEESQTIVKDIFSTKKQAILIFKPEGDYYSFYGLDSITEMSTNLLKGNLNYVIKSNNKYAMLEYSPINCGGFSKSEFQVVNDTIKVAIGVNKGYRIWNYYVKDTTSVGEKSF